MLLARVGHEHEVVNKKQDYIDHDLHRLPHHDDSEDALRC